MNIEDALSHLKREPRFNEIIEQVAVPDFRPSGRVYYDLLESIVSQQLSVKVATVIFNRFLNLFPDQYPHPPLLTDFSIEQLRSVGLSNQKANYLKNVAVFAAQNNMEHTEWSGKTDEEIIKALTSIKGVGVWTAQMILMFTLGRPDVFPVDDLGIQQAMMRLYNIDETGKELKLKMTTHAEKWRPYRTVACRYLWKWKDNSPL